MEFYVQVKRTNLIKKNQFPGATKNQSSNPVQEKSKVSATPKLRPKPLETPNKKNCDVLSQCSSASSVKSFVTVRFLVFF